MTGRSAVRTVTLPLLVAFSPVFLGGIGRFDRPWSGAQLTALERFLWALGPYHVELGLAAVLLAVAAVDRFSPDDPAPREGPVRAMIVLLLALLSLALLQRLPLPRGLLALLSPSTAGELAFLVPGDDRWRPLSISPESTAHAVEGLLLALAVVLAAGAMVRRRSGALIVATTLVVTYTACALYGMASTYAGDDSVMGLARASSPGVTGFFWNRSHMAAAAGLALPVALALAWWCARVRDAAAAPRRAAGVAVAACAAVLAVVLPLTRSRMGFVAAAVGIVVFALLALRTRRWPAVAKAALIVALPAAIAAVGVYVVRQVPALEERFAMGRTGEGFFDIRFPAWRSTLVLAARYPVFGTGLGTYETSIHETQSADNPRELIHAHCEPLEALADGGLLGLGLGALLVLTAARAAFDAAGSRDLLRRALGCGAGGGLAALLTGCLTEFHLHIPSLAVAALVTATLPAVAEGRRHAGAPADDVAGVPRLPAVLACIAVAAVLAGLVVRSGHMAIRGAAVRAQRGGDARGWLRAATDLRDTGSGGAFAHRSRAGALLFSATEADRTGQAAEALEESERAIALEPFHPYNHWVRAQALVFLGRTGEAATAIRRSLSRGGGIGHLHFRAGESLLYLSMDDVSLRPQAYAALRHAGRISPGNFGRAVALTRSLGLEADAGSAIVPERPYALLRWAESRLAAGDGDGAREFADRAASMSPFESVAAKAAAIRERALRLAPEDGE